MSAAKHTYVNPELAPTLSGHLDLVHYGNKQITFDYTGNVPGLLTLAGTIYPQKKEAVISTITVDPDYRRKGLGRRIVSELENILHEQDVQVITGESTEMGVPFWNSLDYSVEDYEDVGEYGDTVRRMEKNLGTQHRKSAKKARLRTRQLAGQARLSGLRES